MLGVPSGWREQVWDTLGKTEARSFKAFLQKADVISPWTPDATRPWKRPAFTRSASGTDYQWCIAHGIDYMPGGISRVQLEKISKESRPTSAEMTDDSFGSSTVS